MKRSVFTLCTPYLHPSQDPISHMRNTPNQVPSGRSYLLALSGSELLLLSFTLAAVRLRCLFSPIFLLSWSSQVSETLRTKIVILTNFRINKRTPDICCVTTYHEGSRRCHTGHYPNDFTVPTTLFLVFLSLSPGIRNGDLRSFPFASIRPALGVIGIPSCRVHGGRNAQQ